MRGPEPFTRYPNCVIIKTQQVLEDEYVADQDPPKGERPAEFFRRLAAAPAAPTFDEAYAQLSAILIAVEDEMTSIPFDPTFPLNDGRMYPPLRDNLHRVRGRSDLRRFRHVSHSTFIADNGAIEIRTGSGNPKTSRTLFAKPGADGRGISGDEP